MLSFIPFISLLWSNPIARVLVVAGLAFSGGFVKGWLSYPRVDVAAITRNAEAGRDAEWSRKLAETEEQARLAVDAAIEAGAHAGVDPSADLVELCRKSTACRANPHR